MTIVIDMDKAREIKKQELRFKRQPELDKLDVEFQKALERNNQAEMARIAELKQRLRDITIDPLIDAAKTTDELNNITVDNILK